MSKKEKKVETLTDEERAQKLGDNLYRIYLHSFRKGLVGDQMFFENEEKVTKSEQASAAIGAVDGMRTKINGGVHYDLVGDVDE